MPEGIPFYEPGSAITVHAAAALSGKRAVAVSANRQSGPGLATTGEGGNIVVNYPTAGAKIFGVLAFDVPVNGKGKVYRGSGFVVPITAAGVIAANADVEIGANGQVITKASGTAIGFAVNGCANGADCEVALYM